ncbi:unnamed protein product, partial [Mesorhabditis spiculigera]
MPAEPSISDSRHSSVAKSHSDSDTWLLLAGRPDAEIELTLTFGDDEKAVENVLKKDKLLIFTVPVFGVLSTAPGTLTLKCGDEIVKIPVTQRPIEQKADETPSTSVDNSHLFQFAENGDSQQLTRPFAHAFHKTDNEGNTVLHIAARNQQSFAMRTFLSSCESLSDEERKTLLNKRNSRGQTALQCAIRAGDADSVHYLIASGAPLDTPDNHQNTAFHYLGDTYSDAIFKEVIEAGSGMNEELEKKNQQGQTPLIVAVTRLKLSLVEMLLDTGLQVDGADATGRTALMHAITMNDPDIIAHLLQKGADVNHQDENGDTPLLLSKQASNFYIMGALLDAGADPAVKNSKGICLADNPDQTTRDVIAGQRIAPELKPFGQAHNPLFGRSVGGGGADGGSGSESGEDIPIQIDESPRSSRPSTAGRRAGDPIPISAGSALDDDEDLGMSPEQGPSSSTTPGRSRKSRFESSNFAKDDISSLDYLTRLRLSKILDNNAKWQDLAMELECGHMTELIQICADENSSPTMIFLDQYEMVPGSKVSAMRTGFVALGLPECVKLLDERVTY